MMIVCGNRTCLCSTRREVNYCPGNRPPVVSKTNLVDLDTGIRGGSDRIWLEVKPEANN
jgi:hypothetical protein